jgi:calcineurin-like phosphoesterase family protein
MIYFTSDTHYNHKNIVKGVSRWDDKSGCRDFGSIKEMNDRIIEGINSCVKEDDVLFHLGDWSFHGDAAIYELRGRIKCKNVHLILGNHDTELYEKQEIHSLFSSVSFYREINVNGQKIVLCHYPLRTWNKIHHGAWMLHGHCHGKLRHQVPAELLLHLLENRRLDDVWKLARNEEVKDLCPNGRSLDVGIDTHPEFRPYSITEIYDLMQTRFFQKVDDHTEKKRDK